MPKYIVSEGEDFTIETVSRGYGATRATSFNVSGVDGAVTTAGAISSAGALTASSTLTVTGASSFAGAVTLSNVNVILGTGAGTKFGTSAAQLMGFYNATPVVQPASVGEATGFTAGGGTTATHTSTFTGNTGTKAYTVGDIVKHLKTLGLIAAS